MKKKTIEKIPYLTLPAISREKSVKYIGVTAFKNVAHERCLFLEIYKNGRNHTSVPKVRIVLTKKDFGTYFPETGTWTRKIIKKNYTMGFIWNEHAERIYKKSECLKKENILYSPQDLQRIKKSSGNISIWDEGEWWNYIYCMQKDITAAEAQEKRRRENERRSQALKEREEMTPELPEAYILQYADEFIFNHEHYLYYKKHGSRADVACSACGGVAERRWKAGISYESQFQSLIQEPVEDRIGTCPMCGARGVYKPQGRMKASCTKKRYMFLGQKYKTTGMVFSYIEVEKRFELQMTCGEKGPEMYSSREVLSGVTHARAYFEEGNKVQIDFHKHNPYTGKDFWDDCNFSYHPITIKEGKIIPDTFANMKGTILQYSELWKYRNAVMEDINVFDYMKTYMSFPQIEMLVKMNLTETVRMMVKQYYISIKNKCAKRVDRFLGIRKEKVKFLIERRGSNTYLKVLQEEKRLEQRWTDEQTEHLSEIWTNGLNLVMILQHMSIQQFLNRVEKYAGCEFGTECSHAQARLRETAQTYVDYLDMRQQAGYDLTNTIYQYPKNLSAAHNKMVMETVNVEMDKRIAEVEQRFPLIRKQYRKLLKHYFFEDEKFTIRPAKSAEEIVIEGRILHHCVGGNDYLKKHNNGETFILLLRYKEDNEVPYITVEIDQNSHIIQWYGAGDKKPDRENIQKWLDAYVTRLKCGMEAGMPSDDDRMQMLSYA